MLLRNGQATQFPLLDRLVYFDPRSRAYPITEVLPATSPRSYTWALGTAVLDQGSEGSCVGHGVAHELAARPVVVSGVNHDLAVRIYHDAQTIDEWPGGSYPGADPVYEGTSVLAGIKVAKGDGHYSEYRWAFGLDDLIRGVGLSGPAVIGVNWHAGMFRPDPSGYIHPTGPVMGGHCVLVLGVSLTRREFLVANSWGEDWSACQWGSKTYRGYCKITFEGMGTLLDESGEACLPTRTRVA